MKINLTFSLVKDPNLFYKTAHLVDAVKGTGTTIGENRNKCQRLSKNFLSFSYDLP